MSEQLRFDGLYSSEPLEGGIRRNYLRFYPNGEVVAASVSEPSTAEQVGRWLGAPERTDSRGRYEVSGSELSFDTVFPGSVDYRDGTEYPDVRVEYKGPVLEDGSLHLASYSFATDFKSEATYRFEPIA